MIDEKKLIERFNQLKGCDSLANMFVKDVIKEIKNQPKSGGWIPCSERLPEESLKSVLGWDEYSQRCCFVQYYNGRWIFGNAIESVKITAWQPVPAPYKN